MNNLMRPTIAGIILLLDAGLSQSAAAQLPVDSLRLAIGFGVEATASPEREILALWKRYLTEPSDSLRATLWSTQERSAGPHFDLVSPYVYQGFKHFTVVHLGPAVGLPHTFAIRTLVTAVEDSTQDVRPLALYRVYATMEDGRWVYFTDDFGETLRALGLEFFPFGGDPVGGRSNVPVRHVYVGSSAHGEDYLHELAHIVLASEVSRGTSRLVAEGLMTWTGGSAGLDYAELLPALAKYLSDHPELTLQSLLENPPPRVGSLDVGYGGLAVLCKMVFDRGGLSDLRALLSAGKDPTTVVSTAAHVLGVSPAELDSMWRKECGVR